MSKELVNLIKKMAQEADLEDAPGVGAPKPKPAASSTEGAHPAIQEMQKRMVGLATAVTAQIKITDIAPKEPIPTGTVVDKDHPLPEPTQEQTSAASRGSFGDFIAKNYLRHSDVPGVEFDPTPTKSKMKDKSPSVATRMGVIMDTMMRIGGEKSELNPDGKWGPRTNAALHNAYALAYALLKLASDFQLPVRSYTTSNLQDLKNRVPADHTEFKFQEKAEQAKVISKHLVAITALFNEIKDGILERPAYQAFIEGDKPYATYSKTKGETPNKPSAPVLNEQAIAALREQFKGGFKISTDEFDEQADNFKTVSITIDDLLSVEALKNWMYKNKLGRQHSLKDIIQSVRSEANGITNRPLPPKYDPKTPQQLARELRIKKNLGQV